MSSALHAAARGGLAEEEAATRQAWRLYQVRGDSTVPERAKVAGKPAGGELAEEKDVSPLSKLAKLVADNPLQRAARAAREAVQDFESGKIAQRILGVDELAACATVIEAAKGIHQRRSLEVGPLEAARSVADLAASVWRVQEQQELQDVARLGRWMVLSAASYGRLINWSMGLFLNSHGKFEGPTEGGREDVFLASAAATCGSSVLMHSLASPIQSMYRPAYAIFEAGGDEKAIVVAVRGTSSMRELLADLVCVPQAVPSKELFQGQMPEGFPAESHVHNGMWRGARSLSDELKGPIKALLESRPDHEVVLTGHSLGAGVTALLCLLWRPWLGQRVRAVVYATPQVLDLDAARLAGDYGVTTVIVGSDVVPRLSLRSAEALLVEVERHAAKRRREKAGDSEESNHLADAQAEAGQAFEERATEIAQLYPPGRLLYLPRQPPQPGGDGAPKIEAKVVDQEAFGTIKVSRSMIVEHFQTTYLEAFGVR